MKKVHPIRSLNFWASIILIDMPPKGSRNKKELSSIADGTQSQESEWMDVGRETPIDYVEILY